MNRLFQPLLLPALFLFILTSGCSEKNKIQSRFSFVKTVVAESLSEPVQMAELPTGKIVFIERYGAIKLFDPATGTLSKAAELPVVHPPEEGLLGLAIDPNWSQNHWIYVYYSPVSNEVVNQLSRFVFDENTGLDLTSEKVLIKIPVQRQECCHSGGGLQFGPDSCLYIAVGDNTNATDDYAVIDERPGRDPWDAQKSASNTMDLRGKILRIKPQPDGSYICPAGNLFVKQDVRVTPGAAANEQAASAGTAAGKPEIYIMGCRNPFRISLDARRKLLFWADVGPDASEPDTARGPESYDEINRAAAAGNYGWPYFIADNKAYRDYDYATKKSGPYFDPQHPFNDSPNNTGARDLPPAQPALIWYPYGPSAEFPLVDEYEGEGGRSAMVGPVYYADRYPEATRLPDHYDGKLFIYDWMRHWVMAVSLDSAGNYTAMERFAGDVKLTSPVDMLIDRNGVMWVLEYGTGRYTPNPDARLVRLDLLRENRAPLPVLEADKTAGAAPLTVEFSCFKTRDPEGDALSYEIDFGDGSQRWMNDDAADDKAAIPTANSDIKGGEAGSPSTAHRVPPAVQHTFENTGTYEVILKVTDVQGKSDTTTMLIHVGNEPPLVMWDLGGKNRSFYKSGDVLNYKIVVDDLEEGTLANTGIAPAGVSTTVDYLETGFDMSRLTQKQEHAGDHAAFAKGKTLIDRNDCKTCHAPDRLVNGPAYQAIAERYRNNPSVAGKLVHKIINGGGGAWGTTVMTPHPQLSEADANEIVRWILSLGAAPKPKQSLPVAGKFALSPKGSGTGTYLLRAAYRDKGAKGQAPLEGSATLVLRPAFQQAEQADSISKGVVIYHPFDNEVAALNNLIHNAFFCYKYADLTGLQAITLRVGSSDRLNQFAGGRIELRLDSPDGPLAGQVDIPASNATGKMEFLERTLPLSAPADGHFHDLYFVVKNENAPTKPVATVDWVRFNFSTQ